MSLRLVFFGSDEFAVTPMNRLVEGPHDIAAIVTRPDMPSGRGLKVGGTPIATCGVRCGIPVLKPASLTREEFADEIGALEWDAGVVVAYGGLIPRWLLEAPRLGFVNLHPSLLPRYRGAAPVERALMNGASVTGVTTIALNEWLDAGDILEHCEEPIYEDDTAGILRQRLSSLGARLLHETLDDLERGGLQPVPQDEEKATFAPPVSTAEGNVEWSHPAESIDRLVRALDPQPGAYTFLRGRRVKLWQVRPTDVPPEDEPGTIMNLGKEGFLVNTGTTGLQILHLQPEGRQKMTAAEFSRGQRLDIAESFTREP